MQYQEVFNERGERLWIPLLAGAALISAPLWFNNKNCNNGNCNYYPYPTYQQYPYPYPYPYPVPYEQQVIFPTFQSNYYNPTLKRIQNKWYR